MEIASIVSQYYEAYKIKYKNVLLPGHINALHSIQRCRTPDSGELYVCCPKCCHSELKPLSCGHRSCPKCQNHETSQWIDRQQNKLLSVLYFMVTFTLPYELRILAWNNQKTVYSILFACAASTLKDFGLNSKNLGAETGMTMAKVFRVRFIAALNEAKLPIPAGISDKWVVDCTRAGKGITALKYLSRYLYRGVISEKNIITNRNGHVTFKYIESHSKETRYRTLKGENFLYLIMQHVLPKGFRRVRDFGFLHSNAKKLFSLVQLILHVSIKIVKQRPGPVRIAGLVQQSDKIVARTSRRSILIRWAILVNDIKFCLYSFF